MKLVALRCPRCNELLQPQFDETLVTGCAQCRAVVALDERGVRQAAVGFAAPARDAQDLEWVPFWVFTGQVRIIQRQTQGGRSSEQQAADLWRRATRFYLPAWELPVPEARALGSLLVQTQPIWQPLEPPPPVSFRDVTVSSADALKLMEFVVISIEAERKDWLRDLRFNIETSKTNLWLLPARYNGRSWQLRAATSGS